MGDIFPDCDDFYVVMNHEEQYSIWPADKGIPKGWFCTQCRGSRKDCLSWIESHWLDLRPLSVRRSL